MKLSPQTSQFWLSRNISPPQIEMILRVYLMFYKHCNHYIFVLYCSPWIRHLSFVQTHLNMVNNCYQVLFIGLFFFSKSPSLWDVTLGIDKVFRRETFVIAICYQILPLQERRSKAGGKNSPWSKGGHAQRASNRQQKYHRGTHFIMASPQCYPSNIDNIDSSASIVYAYY